MIGPTDALIVVDVQKDFLPGGSLAVPGGDEVIPALNRAVDVFAAAGRPVFATRDWHPEGHCSFRERGGPWPRHCVAGSEGARFAPALRLAPSTIIVSKGAEPDKDAYSGFQGTDLARMLRALGSRRVFIGGLATDYCVLATAKDALATGFLVALLEDAARAVDPAAGRRALEKLAAAGAERTTSAAL